MLLADERNNDIEETA